VAGKDLRRIQLGGVSAIRCALYRAKKMLAITILARPTIAMSSY
jgi:hypothetical protein